MNPYLFRQLKVKLAVLSNEIILKQQVNHQISIREVAHMKWKMIVPLLLNSICPLFILIKGHSQLSVTEDVKGGPYIYWLHVQGDYFVLQSLP